MKLWIFSDLHLEYAPLREPLVIPDADVCVVAGDLCRGSANGVRWLAEHIAPSMPCVYVAGNHEFYKGSIREGLEECRRAAQIPRRHFLENDAVAIGGIPSVVVTHHLPNPTSLPNRFGGDLLNAAYASDTQVKTKAARRRHVRRCGWLRHFLKADVAA